MSDQSKQYQEIYKGLPLAELLYISKTDGIYNDIAIQTAISEIESREVSDEEMHTAENIAMQKLDQDRENLERVKDRESRQKELQKQIIDSFNPFNSKKEVHKRLISLIILIFIPLTAYQTYHFLNNSFNFYLIRPLTILLDLQPIVMPIAIVLFLLRKKWGHILLTAVFTLNVANSALNFHPIIKFLNEDFFGHVMYDWLDLATNIGYFLFYLSLVRILALPAVIKAYKTKAETMVNTILVAILYLVAIFIAWNVFTW